MEIHIIISILRDHILVFLEISDNICETSAVKTSDVFEIDKIRGSPIFGIFFLLLLLLLSFPFYTI